MKEDRKTEGSAFSNFFDIVKAVRKGCPWDREQTPLSLRSTFFEETCEAIDAITQGDSGHVMEELGDVLLNVVLIAYLFEEKGLFTVQEIIDGIAEKLVRRHPHVFAQSAGKSEAKEDVTNNAEKVLNQWDRIKENVEGRKSESILDSVPENFPPVLKAYKELKKAAKSGFDWNSLSEVKMKLREEFGELQNAFDEMTGLYDYDQCKPFSAIAKTKEEKVAIVKTQIREVILKWVTEAEIDYKEWTQAGSIKRSQVIQKIYTDYPILSKVANQDEIINWIDTAINDALKTVRKVVEENTNIE